MVTIEGTGGRRLYLKVENPYNLDAAKVGEPVVAHFYEVVTIRKKKPGETVPSASLKEGIATAQPGQVPAQSPNSGRVSSLPSTRSMKRMER